MFGTLQHITLHLTTSFDGNMPYQTKFQISKLKIIFPTL